MATGTRGHPSSRRLQSPEQIIVEARLQWTSATDMGAPMRMLSPRHDTEHVPTPLCNIWILVTAGADDRLFNLPCVQMAIAEHVWRHTRRVCMTCNLTHIRAHVAACLRSLARWTDPEIPHDHESVRSP